MPPSFKVAEAYVELGVKGQVTEPLRTARRDAEQFTSTSARDSALIASNQQRQARSQVQSITAIAAATALATRAAVGGMKQQIVLKEQIRQQDQKAIARLPKLMSDARSFTSTRQPSPFAEGVRQARRSFLDEAASTRARAAELKGESAQQVQSRVAAAEAELARTRDQAEKLAEQIQQTREKKDQLTAEVARLEQAKRDTEAAGEKFNAKATLGPAKGQLTKVTNALAELESLSQGAQDQLAAAQQQIERASQRDTGLDLKPVLTAYYAAEGAKNEELLQVAKQRDDFFRETITQFQRAANKGKAPSSNVIEAYTKDLLRQREEQIVSVQQSILGNLVKQRNLGSGEGGEQKQELRLMRLQMQDAEGTANVQRQMLELQSRLIDGDRNRAKLAAEYRQDLQGAANDAREQVVRYQERNQVIATPEGQALVRTQYDARMDAVAEEAKLKAQILAIETQQIGTGRQREALAQRTRNEFQQASNDLAEQNIALAERERFMRSPEGRRQLQDQARLAREQEQAQKRIQKLQREALPRSMRPADPEVEERRRQQAQEFQANAARTFAAGSAAIVGLSGLANPFAVERFRNALADTGAVVGRTLVPTLEAATEKVRAVGDWFVQLDPATKRAAASVITYGTAIAGAAVIVPRLIGAVKGLAGAMTLLGRAMFVNPIGLAITAVVGLGEAIGRMTTGKSLLRGIAEELGLVENRTAGAKSEMGSYLDILSKGVDIAKGFGAAIPIVNLSKLGGRKSGDDAPQLDRLSPQERMDATRQGMKKIHKNANQLALEEAFRKTPGGQAGASFSDSTSFGAAGRDAQFMDSLSYLKAFQLDAAKSRLPTLEELQKAGVDLQKGSVDQQKITNDLLREMIQKMPATLGAPLPQAQPAPTPLMQPRFLPQQSPLDPFPPKKDGWKIDPRGSGSGPRGTFEGGN